MGLLSSIVKKAAPKIVKAVTIGGSKTERDMLKTEITKPVFDPVFQKFGDTVESTAKIGLAIATAGLGADLLKGTSGNTGVVGSVLKNVAPTTKDMSLLGGLVKGVFNDVKPQLAQLGVSALGKLVTGIGTKQTQIIVPPVTTGSGTSTGSTTPKASGNWYEKNKSWVNPLGVGVGIITVVVALVKLIFGRRRR